MRIADRPNGVLLALKVVPGAKRDRIVGELGEALKVAVSKPPEAGAANRAVIALLAEALGVGVRDLEIVRGWASARKEILIHGLGAADVRARLENL